MSLCRGTLEYRVTGDGEDHNLYNRPLSIDGSSIVRTTGGCSGSRVLLGRLWTLTLFV